MLSSTLMTMTQNLLQADDVSKDLLVTLLQQWKQAVPRVAVLEAAY